MSYGVIRNQVAIRTGPVRRLVFAIHTGVWLNWLGLSTDNTDQGKQWK